MPNSSIYHSFLISIESKEDLSFRYLMVESQDSHSQFLCMLFIILNSIYRPVGAYGVQDLIKVDFCYLTSLTPPQKKTKTKTNKTDKQKQNKTHTHTPQRKPTKPYDRCDLFCCPKLTVLLIRRGCCIPCTPPLLSYRALGP